MYKNVNIFFSILFNKNVYFVLSIFFKLLSKNIVQHIYLHWIRQMHLVKNLYSAISLKQSIDKHVDHPTRTRYTDSDLTNLCSYSLFLSACRRSSTYQFYSAYFDLIRDKTHDLPHLSYRIYNVRKKQWIRTTDVTWWQNLAWSYSLIVYCVINYFVYITQSSRWPPIIRPKTSQTLFGPVKFSVFI